jgi:DNA-binding response OmpR family regulator
MFAMGQQTRPLQGKRLLVAEDEPAVAVEYSATLSSAGAQAVTTARTVAQAIDCVREGRVDAAVVDYVLGDRNSATLQTELEEKHIPFVVVSGYPPVLVRTGGDQRVLRKPVTPDHLCAALIAACEGER